MTYVKKTMELDQEDEEWAQKRFPGLSSYWLHRMLMKQFRNEVEAAGIDLEEYARKGAAEVRRMIMTTPEGEVE